MLTVLKMQCVRANDRVKRVEIGSTRAAEQVFRTCELMPSGPVAASGSKVVRTFSTFSGAKKQSPGAIGCTWIGLVQRARDWEHGICK